MKAKTKMANIVKTTRFDFVAQNGKKTNGRPGQSGPNVQKVVVAVKNLERVDACQQIHIEKEIRYLIALEKIIPTILRMKKIAILRIVLVCMF